MIGRRVAFLLLGAISAVALVVFDARRLFVRGSLGVLMLAFLGWSVLSVFWADDSALAVRKVAVFVLLWLGACWTAMRLSPLNLLRFAFVSSVLTMVECLGVELAFGAFQPWAAGYRLGGIYHPNETGQCLLVGVLAALGLATGGARSSVRFGYLGLAAGAAVLLLMTGSRTALISTVAAVSIYWVLVATANRRMLRGLVAFVAVIVVAAGLGYVTTGPDVTAPVAAAVQLDRVDSDIGTLTQRTPLWRALVDDYVVARPWLGYGYASFWTSEHVVAMSLLKSGTVYFHSHSGYLEMALGIGVLGAVVHVLTLLLGARGFAARHRTNRDPGNAFGAALIGALLLSMVTEPTNMSAYLMPTFVVMAFLAQLAFVRDPAEVAQRRVPPLPEVRSL